MEYRYFLLNILSTSVKDWVANKSNENKPLKYYNKDYLLFWRCYGEVRRRKSSVRRTDDVHRVVIRLVLDQPETRLRHWNLIVLYKRLKVCLWSSYMGWVGGKVTRQNGATWRGTGSWYDFESYFKALCFCTSQMSFQGDLSFGVSTCHINDVALPRHATACRVVSSPAFFDVAY